MIPGKDKTDDQYKYGHFKSAFWDEFCNSGNLGIGLTQEEIAYRAFHAGFSEREEEFNTILLGQEEKS